MRISVIFRISLLYFFVGIGFASLNFTASVRYRQPAVTAIIPYCDHTRFRHFLVTSNCNVRLKVRRSFNLKLPYQHLHITLHYII